MRLDHIVENFQRYEEQGLRLKTVISAFSSYCIKLSTTWGTRTTPRSSSLVHSAHFVQNVQRHEEQGLRLEDRHYCIRLVLFKTFTDMKNKNYALKTVISAFSSYCTKLSTTWGTRTMPGRPSIVHSDHIEQIFQQHEEQWLRLEDRHKCIQLILHETFSYMRSKDYTWKIIISAFSSYCTKLSTTWGTRTTPWRLSLVHSAHIVKSIQRHEE